MQTTIASSEPHTGSALSASTARPAGATSSAYAGYQIIRRNGAVVAFEPHKIAVALMKAFLAVHGAQGAASASVRETVDNLTETVVRALLRSRPGGGTFHIEDVQDQVELCSDALAATMKWREPMCSIGNAAPKSAPVKPSRRPPSRPHAHAALVVDGRPPPCPWT
ncbi:MAG: hypothetical protein KatS3mg122_0305 [Caldimonas sp.]|nr:MAG: hypothetical protein KatS3mg122_0305 [Caldimonas sp.]